MKGGERCIAALSAENEAAQPVSQLLGLFGILGRAEALREFKESLLFLLAGLDSQLDELH
jgi:hypothetical protein